VVRIANPPPPRPPRPVFTTLPAGARLVRLFDPSRFGAGPLAFRFFGPLLRFDHQRGELAAVAGQRRRRLHPTLDAERGIYYAGFTLSCCVVEVFGDTGIVEPGEWRVALVELTRAVRLLDLRGAGAMRAGTNAALAKVPRHRTSQAWSRTFYEEPKYAGAEGILYRNAHNDEDALALYERAQDALDCPPERVLRLDDPLLRPALLAIAARHNLIATP